MTEVRDVAVVPTKPWYKSKTLWFNAVVSSLLALEVSFELLKPFLSASIYAYAFVVLTMGNAILRVISNQGISLK